MDKNNNSFVFPFVEIVEIHNNEDIITTSMFSREPAGYTSIDLGRRY